MNDGYELQRFVEAQEGAYPDVLKELRAGRKRSHWMWFVFPQLRGLGRSPMAERYGIGSLEEAKAYAGHAVLGRRVRECTRAALEVEGPFRGSAASRSTCHPVSTNSQRNERTH